MAIQIRPAAVSAQLDNKRGLFDGMRGQIASRQAAVMELQGEENLAGAGFAAATARFGVHGTVLSAISYYLDLVQAADDSVKNALGIFGGEGVVDEQVYLDLQAEAQRNIAAVRENIDYLYSLMDGGDPYLGNAIGGLGACLEIYEAQSARAGEMLSKIYDYCGQTNGAYSSAELQNIMPACSSACAAMSASADPAFWDAQDYGSLVNDIKQAAVTPVKSMEDIYTHNDGGSVVNEDNVHALMGKPFELWTQEELDACAKAYNAMSENKDNASIERFIGASYSYAGMVFYSPNLPDDAPLEDILNDDDTRVKSKWVLAPGFVGFAEAYAKTVSEIAINNQMNDQECDLDWENAAYAGLLWGVALNAPQAYTLVPSTPPIGNVQLIKEETEEGEMGGAAAVVSFSLPQKRQMYEDDIEIKASGNLFYYADHQIDEAYLKLMVDADKKRNIALSKEALFEASTEIAGALGKEVPGLGFVVASADIYVEHDEDVKRNAIAEEGITWHHFHSAADGAEFNGIVCDGSKGVTFIGIYDEETLRRAVSSYDRYIEKNGLEMGMNEVGVDEKCSVIMTSIQENGLSGAMEYSGENKGFRYAQGFLDNTRGNTH